MAVHGKMVTVRLASRCAGFMALLACVSFAQQAGLSRGWDAQAAMPVQYGSQELLEACWSPGELQAKEGEKRSFKEHPLAHLGAPERSRPLAPDQAFDPAHRGSIRRVDTNGRKVVALGFDIGERNNDHAGFDGGIIDYLRSEGIPATLYMGGKWMATHPERSMQLIADPLFELGNHAWTHGNFRQLTLEEARDQIFFTEVQYEMLRDELLSRPCAREVKDAHLAIPQRLVTFRFPYGTCRAETLEAVNQAGMPAIQWDTVTGDPASFQTAGGIAAELLSMKPGSIAVMHANGRGWKTEKALRMALPQMRALGFEFVTVADLLGMGEPVATATCFERKPGDNLHYDRLFGKGTGD